MVRHEGPSWPRFLGTQGAEKKLRLVLFTRWVTRSRGCLRACSKRGDATTVSPHFPQWSGLRLSLTLSTPSDILPARFTLGKADRTGSSCPNEPFNPMSAGGRKHTASAAGSAPPGEEKS